MEPVELALPAIPDIDFNFNFEIDGKLPPLPILPILPILPPFPKINFKFPISVSLPELPNLISPPSVPNLLEPVIALVKALKKLIKLLCYVVGGIAPVPEWYVAGYVQQLTNRTLLFDLDFIQPALSPVISSLLEFEDTQIILHARLGVPTGILEVLNQTVATIQGIAQCTVEQLGRMSKGDFSSQESCATTAGSAQASVDTESLVAKENTFPTEEFVWDLNNDDVPEAELTLDQRAQLLKYILTECKSSRRLSKMVNRDRKTTLYEPFGQAVTAFLY